MNWLMQSGFFAYGFQGMTERREVAVLRVQPLAFRQLWDCPWNMWLQICWLRLPLASFSMRVCWIRTAFVKIIGKLTEQLTEQPSTSPPHKRISQHEVA